MRTVADYLLALDADGDEELVRTLPPVLVQLVKDDKVGVPDVTPLAGTDVDKVRDITLLPVYSVVAKTNNERVSVGRSRSADVTVNLERLSKIHALLRVCSNGDLEVDDAGSKNGTYIGPSKVDAGKKMRLKDCGTLHLGPYPFRYFQPKSFVQWLERTRGSEGPTVTGTEQQRLEIIGPLGRGGMADVALARRIGPGGFKKEIALKRLLPEMAHDKNFVDMFLQEAKIAARISHPNVVQIFDLGWDGQRYFIAMEYVPGWNLATVQRASRRVGETPVAAAVHVALDLCAGLKAAHASVDEHGSPLRIIHRDVSPQNVLLSVDGNAKLSDFGVSRAADSIRRTKTGELKGKLAYMAPEQLEERFGEVDHRTDIWSAAATIYETFVGFSLFKRGNDVETMQALLHDPIPDLRTVRADVPKRLASAVMRGLERLPSKRTSEIAQLHGEIADVAVELGVGGPETVGAWLESLVHARALPHVGKKALDNDDDAKTDVIADRAPPRR